MKTIRRLAVAGAAWMMVAMPAHALWVSRPPADSEPVPRRSVLLYAGGAGRRHYSVSDLMDMVGAVDTADQLLGWLCHGAILLELRAASGRNYYPLPGVAAHGEDWNAYLDSLFTPGGVLPTLDSAVAIISARRGPVPGGFRVALMIPYPARVSDTVWVGRRPFLLAGPDGRRSVVEAYVGEVERRFGAARLSHLKLFGYYWLNEGILSDDTLLVQLTSAVVHERARRFLWIPSFHAPGSREWRRYGFDFAWLQPNFFFHPEVAVTRLDTALADARAAGMGLEIEFDVRMFNDWRFSDRLAPYLSLLQSAEDVRAMPITIYEAGGALIHLARSHDPWQRALYARLVAALRSP